MDDNARMIAAAKRKARRIAHTDGITHQQALDRIARDLRREHWGDFIADPAPVPRDTLTSEDEKVAPDAGMLRMPDREAATRPDWNALAAPEISTGGQAREARRAAIADMMIPPGHSPHGFFDDHGRRALEGFLMLEVDRAIVEDRTPSIPAMTIWIRDGIGWAAPRAGDIVDITGRWLRVAASQAQDHGIESYITDRIGSLAAMSRRERDSVLATMDQALSPFADSTGRMASAQ